MVTFEFYRDTYGGDSVPQEEFAAYARDAETQLARYQRIYTVTEVGENGTEMAQCAMIDALYFFSCAENGALGAASVSVGSVSSSRAQGTQPDLSPAARSRELYRCACLYLEICRSGGERR